MFLKYSKLIFLAVLLWQFSACTFEQEEAATDCSALKSFAVLESTPANCGEDNGTIIVQAEFDNQSMEGVTYSINGESAVANPSFDNLSAGTYEIVVNFNADCSEVISAQVENKDGLNISVATTNSDCDAATGRIDIDVSGAIGDVSFKINNEAPQNNTQFVNLAPGEYTILAIDDSGCEINQEVIIRSTISDLEIENLVKTNCALSNCHGGNISPDFSVTANISLFANRIGQRTGNRTMPPTSSGNSLDQSEIDAIACWVFDNQ